MSNSRHASQAGSDLVPEREAADDPLPITSSRSKVTFQQRSAELQTQILQKPPTPETLLDFVGVMMMQERVNLHDTLNELMDQLDNPGDRADVYKDFAEVTYKRDKIVVEFQHARQRAREAKAQAEATRRPRLISKPAHSETSNGHKRQKPR
jgi:hypothetical protein